MYSISVLLLAIIYSVKANASSQSGKMEIRLSITSKENNSGDLQIPFRDCGYIFCHAPDVPVNETVHNWDYYVDWLMPSSAERAQENKLEGEKQVFVLGNRFQMPRAYLVFRGFDANITGQYTCILNFRRQPVASYTLNLSLSDIESTKNCIGNTP